MKKILILFTMLFAFTCISYAGVSDVLTNSVDSVYHDGKAVVDTVYHDGKNVVSTVYQDAKEGATSIYPDVKSAIISIGKAIGVAAEHVYGVLVKKYFVIGVKELCVFIGGLLMLLFGCIYWRKYSKDATPISYGLLMPLTLIIVGLCIVINVDYDGMLMGLINPEYGAINYILEYTKGLVK